MKPSNMKQLLNTFSKISKPRNTFSCKKCNKCTCGNHGSLRNMLYKKDVLTVQKKSIKIKSNLNCKSLIIVLWIAVSVVKIM